MALGRPFDLPKHVGNTRGARSVQRILEAAARLFGTEGFQGASMHAVARAAGVSKGLLHYHFRSKEHLLIEAQRATFRQIHRRFDDRFRMGERGLEPAIEALDALWEAVSDMRSWTPFMVETMSQSIGNASLREAVDEFYEEAMGLLEGGIREVFADDLDRLVLPPERLAFLVRTGLHGLVIELSRARSEAEIAAVHQAYRDLRDQFATVALRPRPSPAPPPEEAR